MRQLKITQSITNRRESHTLEKYFTEVSSVPMITPDEEVTLAQIQMQHPMTEKTTNTTQVKKRSNQLQSKLSSVSAC